MLPDSAASRETTSRQAFTSFIRFSGPISWSMFDRARVTKPAFRAASARLSFCSDKKKAFHLCRAVVTSRIKSPLRTRAALNWSFSTKCRSSLAFVAKCFRSSAALPCRTDFRAPSAALFASFARNHASRLNTNPPILARIPMKLSMVEMEVFPPGYEETRF